MRSVCVCAPHPRFTTLPWHLLVELARNLRLHSSATFALCLPNLNLLVPPLHPKQISPRVHSAPFATSLVFTLSVSTKMLRMRSTRSGVLMMIRLRCTPKYVHGGVFKDVNHNNFCNSKSIQQLANFVKKNCTAARNCTAPPSPVPCTCAQHHSS